MRFRRYVRAYLAGIALPTVVVCAAGFMVVVLFDGLEPPTQRALIIPLAMNASIWGLWNILWVALGPRKRLELGPHGVVLAVLLIATGVLLAPGLGLSRITPRTGLTVVLPVGIAYYVLWRYGVAFLNAIVEIDTADGDAGARIA